VGGRGGGGEGGREGREGWEEEGEAYAGVGEGDVFVLLGWWWGGR